jgi:EAL domain-containing protein (putative c-di-GMP-specific phosphodiesterase class I)/DNA-binding response OmpR family regulator
MTRPAYPDARILVLDDNPVNVELLSCLLEDNGYRRVEGETDPRRLARRLAQDRPDLLLLDIRMPHLDGFGVLARLREEWAELAPPVIVLTAQTDKDTRFRALSLGARDFLPKPFDQFEVLQRIHNVLEVHFLLQQRSSRARLLEDLVEQRTAELHRLSLADLVTERPNRRALLESLQRRLGGRERILVYFIALEGMDDIARLHGYGVADALNRALGERLGGCLDPAGIEFGVWSSTEWLVLEPAPADPERLARRARGLIEQLTRAFEIDHLLLHLAVRVGVSHSGFEHDSAERLVRLASLALPADNNRWQLYQPALEERLHALNRYRQALRHATDNDELFLVYQPKVDLSCGRITGAEALLRWVNPELGFISPADFIPIAEASGDILRLGDWVIDAAIGQLELWRDQRLVAPDFRVAVNVATLQLMQPGFAEALIHRLRRSRLPRGALEIEVTESGLMQDVELALSQLRLLAAEGIDIAIDDFGTGYSSLAYLKSLPVSVLKIDRAFVNDLDTDAQGHQLAKTVVHLARNLGCTTVAEGVERAEHITLLKEMGCLMVQGYWYSPPLRPEAFIDYYLQHQAGLAD